MAKAKGDRRTRKSQQQRRLQRPSLKQILSKKIEDLPQLVISYAGPDGIDWQQDVIEYRLQRILHGPHSDPQCTLQPRIEQPELAMERVLFFNPILF
ncbi:hypothetical protein ACJ73_10266 [Blastomyces percursus]|uniref:Uncharacterized protein n=1 Tax=Blastomyces percursus TaxID=1658174 RepID=A0A1J9Q0L9_9EURO|nr:hypothetical protein ACJ73_10266 [Blastomyces percursus]